MEATATPWHLSGNWTPVFDELTVEGLRVDGTIPPALDGTYVRTGPNPHTGTSRHWFLGDGMVHGIRLRDGRAEWYRNRFVQTPHITGTPSGRDAANDVGDLSRGTGNTHIVAHNGKLLALEEGHWPWALDGELNTLGHESFGGALTCSLTAHPKICPTTGELIGFSYFSFEPPYLHYVRIGPDGVVRQLEPIDIPRMVMMHDFNVTASSVVFMDLPLVFDLSQARSGIPFRFDPEAGARLGLMPRDGTNADLQWFEIDPCYVFHPVNAHDEADGRVVLHVSRMESAFGASSDDYAEVGRLWRWTIDPARGTVHEEEVDGRPGDFGRVDDRLVGHRARHAYLMALAGEGNAAEPVYGSQLLKYDLATGACTEHELGDGVRGGEPVFVPAGPDAAEGEGWVMAIVHDTSGDHSSLVIIDAERFGDAPVARVHLPRRVPYGAHGNWVPADRLV